MRFLNASPGNHHCARGSYWIVLDEKHRRSAGLATCWTHRLGGLQPTRRHRKWSDLLLPLRNRQHLVGGGYGNQFSTNSGVFRFALCDPGIPDRGLCSRCDTCDHASGSTDVEHQTSSGMTGWRFNVLSTPSRGGKRSEPLVLPWDTSAVCGLFWPSGPFATLGTPTLCEEPRAFLFRSSPDGRDAALRASSA